MKRSPMITLVFSGALVALVNARPQQSPYYNPADKDARIVRYDSVPHKGDGNYQYSYETSNGIAGEETGFLKNPGSQNEIQSARGSYQYYGTDGKLYRLEYTADENGFQPVADFLPTPPPIPPEIQKALDIIYANARNQQSAAGQQPTAYQRPQGSFRPPQY